MDINIHMDMDGSNSHAHMEYERERREREGQRNPADETDESRLRRAYQLEQQQQRQQHASHENEPSSSSSSSQTQYAQHAPHIYRPIPRRNFSSALSSNTTISSTAATAGDSSDSSRSPPLHSYNMPAMEPRSMNPPAPPPAPELKRVNSSTSDFLAQINARLLRAKNGYSDRLSGAWDGDTDDGGGDGYDGDGSSGIKKSQSFLNAKSTLFGIMGEGDSIPDTPYGFGTETPGVGGGSFGIGFDEADSTPGHQHRNQYFDSAYGNGAKPTSPLSTRSPLSPCLHTHSRRTSTHTVQQRQQRRGLKRYLAITGKLLSLFAFGAVYGVIVAHLHDARELAAVNVGGVDRGSWRYIAGWGVAGLVFGTMLPWVDSITDGGRETGGNRGARESKGEKGMGREEEEGKSGGEKLNELLRSVAAFAGIAFAIRRLPWESTLQLTLTLALVNPALWYILDRTRNGLSFSLIATSILTSFIFLSYPDVLPSPHLPATSINGSSVHIARSGRTAGAGGHGEELFAGMVSYENLATAIWVGSVIFCSCICFGGIGRRSGLLDEWRVGR